MSARQNQDILSWNLTRDFIASCDVTRGGALLSSRDKGTWADAVVLTAIVWQDLYWSLSTSRLIQWCKRVAHFDVLEVVGVLKDADFVITHLWEEDGSVSIERFKSRIYPSYEHAGVILTPLLAAVNEYLVDLSIDQYRSLHQALAFIGRVTLRDYEGDDAVASYIEHDEALGISDPDLPERMSIIMREWLSGFSVAKLPKHGPGSVADLKVKSQFAKYHRVGTDSLLSYTLRKYCDVPMEVVVPPGALDRSFERIAQLRFVPKNALKRRTICMEPATLQYYQQMVKSALYEHISENLLCRIDLKDQSKNRDLAREGSISGELATIDLSAASDSVQWSLVRTCFKHTALLPWLYCTRSRWIACRSGHGGKAKRTIFRPKMFAPMGSALCFPIECLIFAAVCEDAVRIRHTRSSYRVYGDDIIIETSLVEDIMSRLESLGFTVNKDKSFTLRKPRVFRESCGGEYLDGVDVTAVRLSRKFEGGRLTPSRGDEYQRLIDLSNEFYKRGYIRARRWIIQRFVGLPIGFRPKFGSTADQLLGDCERNYFSPITWNRAYQRLEVVAGTPGKYFPIRCAFLRAMEKASSSYEEYRYFAWFQCRYEVISKEKEKSFLSRKFFLQCLRPKDWIDTCSFGDISDISIDGLIRIEPRRVALI